MLKKSVVNSLNGSNVKQGCNDPREERSTSFISIATGNYGSSNAHQPPLSTKNARSRDQSRNNMNITGDNADFFDTTANMGRGQGQLHVVSALNKRTPNCSIGSKVSSCRTIEEAKMIMSNDQPDAPKQVPNKFVVQKLTYVSQNKENKGKPNLKL